MNILLTGGAGYIGSHIAIVLTNAGHRVIIYDNFCNSDPSVLRQLNKILCKSLACVHGDIQNAPLLRKAFKEFEIDAVVHCAGLKAVGESVLQPIRYYRNNVLGSIKLLEEMMYADVKKLVFSSSATVYGQPNRMPITEEFPLAPINPYGQSKAMVENILFDLYSSDPSWSIACLRYFNPIGAHESGLIGDNPSGNPNNLMPFLLQVAGGNCDRLDVFGGDYLTSDGTGVRDYVHVMDLAQGHLRALDVLEASNFLRVNLGTGQGVSVLQIIQAMEKVSGRPIPYEIKERRSGDAAVCYTDPSYARKILNWSAQFDIERMCQDAWRWQLMSNNK